MAQSTLAAFHAPFLTAAGVPYEHAFCLGEPCVFYCGSSPGALTHVNFIAADYCTVSCQSFEIPRLQAQKYLLHLSLGEMEREVLTHFYVLKFLYSLYIFIYKLDQDFLDIQYIGFLWHRRVSLWQ